MKIKQLFYANLKTKPCNADFQIVQQLKNSEMQVKLFHVLAILRNKYLLHLSSSAAKVRQTPLHVLVRNTTFLENLRYQYINIKY
jgi:hypothetical protein